MPKFFNDPYVLAPRVNEDLWFKQNQRMLLRMVNTKYGRDLLCVDQHYPVIIEISKRHIKAYRGTWGGRHHFVYDFRVGAKWANVIRFRWEQFQSYSRYFLNDDIPALLSPTVRQVRSLVATSTTAYPEPSGGSTTTDGITYVDGLGDAAWSALHDHGGNGAITNQTGASFAEIEDRTSNTWNFLVRSPFLYDTSPIPDTEGIDSATQSHYAYTKADALGLTPTANLYSCNPASNTTLTGTDFAMANWGTTPFCDTAATYAAWSSTGAYFDFIFNAAGKAAISKTGVTKTGGRFVFDATNTSQSLTSNGVGDRTYMFCKFSDETGTGNDPKLVIGSSILATGNFFLLF